MRNQRTQRTQRAHKHLTGTKRIPCRYGDNCKFGAALCHFDHSFYNEGNINTNVNGVVGNNQSTHFNVFIPPPFIPIPTPTAFVPCAAYEPMALGVIPHVPKGKKPDVKEKEKKTEKPAPAPKPVIDPTLGIPKDPHDFMVIPNSGFVYGDMIDERYSNSCMFISIAQLLILCDLIDSKEITVNDLTLRLRTEAKFPKKSINCDQFHHGEHLERICEKYKIGLYLFTVNYSGAIGSAWIGGTPFVDYNIGKGSVLKRKFAIACYGMHFEPIVSATLVTDELTLSKSGTTIKTKSYRYKALLTEKKVTVVTKSDNFNTKQLDDFRLLLQSIGTKTTFPNYEQRLAFYRTTIKELKDLITKVDAYVLKCKMELLDILRTNQELSKTLATSEYQNLVSKMVIHNTSDITSAHDKAIETATTLKLSLQLQVEDYTELVPDIVD
jgi:hypothetical protein